MVTVLKGWHGTGLRLGLQDLDVLKCTVHRSVAGQLRHFTSDKRIVQQNVVERDMLLARHGRPVIHHLQKWLVKFFYLWPVPFKCVR
jgi:hypothetical protein